MMGGGEGGRRRRGARIFEGSVCVKTEYKPKTMPCRNGSVVGASTRLMGSGSLLVRTYIHMCKQGSGRAYVHGAAESLYLRGNTHTSICT